MEQQLCTCTHTRSEHGAGIAHNGGVGACRHTGCLCTRFSPIRALESGSTAGQLNPPTSRGAAARSNTIGPTIAGEPGSKHSEPITPPQNSDEQGMGWENWALIGSLLTLAWKMAK